MPHMYVGVLLHASIPLHPFQLALVEPTTLLLHSFPPSQSDGVCHPSNSQGARYGALVLAVKRPKNLLFVWE